MRRHSHHAGDVGATQCRRTADAGGSAGAEGNRILRRLGFRLFQAAIDPAADARIRPDGFAERAGGVDPGKVLGLDRLRRTPREHPRPRRTARQRHALLGDGDRRLIGAPVLGEFRAEAPHAAQGDDTDRRRRLPQGDRHAGAKVDGSELHEYPALERNAEGRSLRGVRAAGFVRAGGAELSSGRCGSRLFPDQLRGRSEIPGEHGLEQRVFDHRQHDDLVHAGGAGELRRDRFIDLQMFVDGGHARRPGAADAAFALAYRL